MPPSEIVDAVKTEFTVEIERQNVRNYNPEQVIKARNKWGEIFDKEREKFINSSAEIGVAHQSFRLKELNDMALAAKRKGNLVLAGQLLEQAAKECGGLYTNKQTQDVNLQGKMVQMTVDEWRAENKKRRAAAEETLAEAEGEG